jgi:hypothetical protein
VSSTASLGSSGQWSTTATPAAQPAAG